MICDSSTPTVRDVPWTCTEADIRSVEEPPASQRPTWPYCPTPVPESGDRDTVPDDAEAVARMMAELIGATSAPVLEE
jgi:hypothetical protein